MARLKCLIPVIKPINMAIARPLPKKADNFYLSAAWRGLVTRLVRERGACCEQCGRAGIRLFGDHVHELKDGGVPLDAANIRLLCGSCHTKKTIAQRKIRENSVF